MRVSDFMSRDRGDGNRAYRRNVARVHYRGANGASVTMNQRETPQASPPKNTPASAVRAVVATAGAMLAGAVARSIGKVAKAQAPVVAPVVANLDAERAARQRAAKDRKNAAARAKRLASRQAA